MTLSALLLAQTLCMGDIRSPCSHFFNDMMHRYTIIPQYEKTFEQHIKKYLPNYVLQYSDDIAILIQVINHKQIIWEIKF